MIRSAFIALIMILIIGCTKNLNNQPLSIDDQVEYIITQEGLHNIQNYDIFIRKSARTHDIEIEINIHAEDQLIEFEYINDQYRSYTEKNLSCWFC